MMPHHWQTITNNLITCTSQIDGSDERLVWGTVQCNYIVHTLFKAKYIVNEVALH